MDVLHLKAMFTLIACELDIFLQFSWQDWSATIIPGSIFSIGAMRSARLPLPSIISNYLLLISWLTSFVYFFNLSNQITGLNEDRVNKPNRPIPSGKVTLKGAKQQWAIVLSAFLGITMFKCMLLPETICWIFITAFLCLTSAGNHWFGKNCVAMTMGVQVLLSASWKAITLATPESERYVIAV